MKTRKAVKLLEYHNKWRRGKDCPMVSPELLGQAIDKVIDYIDGDIEIDRTEKRTARIDVRISPAIKKKIFALCKSQGLSVADWMVKQIEREML